MTRTELPARAANLQRAVASTATCTSATVESLHAYLITATAPIQRRSTKAEILAPSKKRAAPTSQVKLAGSRTRKQPSVAVLEVAGGGTDAIEPQERFELATEVINATLKALTEAVKNPPSQRIRTPPAKSPSHAPLDNGSNPCSQMPLQPLSVNRITNSPGKVSCFRRSSFTASWGHSLEGLRAQAECARIAFAALRSLEDKGRPTLPALQLESGMSALIGKLIALRFDELAVKELRILRRRLEAVVESPSLEKNLRKPVAVKEAPDAKVENLPGMLMFRNIGAKGQTLALIIASQLQTLRILALRKESLAIEATVQHLHLDVEYSPANLIQMQVDSATPGSQDRAARQLETLAQCVLALCPNTSSAQEKVSNLSLRPDTAFQMQVLALRIRLIWWRLSGHQGDVAKEIIEPFSRCLSAFHRRSRTDQKDTYEVAKTTFQGFQGPVREMGGFCDGMFITLYQSLADLAQESSQHSEALRWVQHSKTIATRCGVSQTQLCSLYCRCAALQLRIHNLEISDEMIAALKDASNSLRGNLQGEPAEIDSLLAAVASLRKSAFYVFQESRRPPSTSKTLCLSAYADECSNIVLLCLNFIIRYVGNDSGQDENQKTIARREQRTRLALQVSTPTIESVVAMARLCSRAAPDLWARFETGLRDCLLLISRLENTDPDVKQTSTADRGPSSSFVSISNAYWYRYLHLKQTAADAKSLRECLRTSIDLVNNRPLCERLAGFLPMKLERYGSLCEERRDYRRAAEVYADSIQAHMHFGVLRTATKAAATRSLPAIWKSNDELGRLSRTLLAYPKVATKAVRTVHNLKAYFDVDDLPADQRGVLLEQQLLFISTRLLEHDTNPVLCETLNKLARSLLQLYAVNDFPVRRLRVIVRLLGLSNSPHALGDDILHRLLHEQFEDCSKTHSDLGLKELLPHLLASRNVYINIRQETPNIKELETVMSSWAHLIQKYPERSSLEAQVYDVGSWLLQLDFVAEYLEMRALDFLRVTTLHLLVTIHETATPICCSTLALQLSALGLQYVRLGYSGAAGQALHKAQLYLEAPEVAPDIRIRSFLSYAEYCLADENPITCKESLKKATETFNENYHSPKTGRSRFSEWSQQSQLIADAYYIRSLLAVAEGLPLEALFYARLSVKNCQRAWALLERSLSRIQEAVPNDLADNRKESLVEAISELSISELSTAENPVAPHSVLQGAAFWTLVPRLFRGLTHVASLFTQHGLIQGSRYYLEESQKVAVAVRAPSLIGQCFALLGKQSICSGGGGDGYLLLLQAENALSSVPHHRNYAMLQLLLATYHTGRGELQAGETAYALAEKAIQDMTKKSFLGSLIHKSTPVESLDMEMGGLTLEEPKTTRRPPKKQGRPVVKKIKSAGHQRPSTLTIEESPDIEMITLSRLKQEIIRERILQSIRTGQIDAAASQLEATSKHCCGQQDIIPQALLESRLRFCQGLARLVRDPVYCVLPESSLSCPSIRTSDIRRRLSASKLPPTDKDLISSKDKRSKVAAKKARPRSHSLAIAEIDFLRIAQDGMTNVFSMARKVSSTATMHQIRDLMARILIMRSATSSPASNAQVSTTHLAYALEVGRLLSMFRESVAIRVERQLALTKDIYVWPKSDPPLGHSNIESTASFEPMTFKADFIDILPRSWTTISLTLSESREDIFICKMAAGRAPFVLRLPLNRHSSIDCDEEAFEFEQGKAELQDIIALANRSASEARDLSRTKARAEWWKARESLDARLKDLLANIESVWLGGFKGIFSQPAQDLELVSRFQQSFQNILDKHLPSRQKSGRGGQSSLVTLDLHVLELFLGLGCPDEIKEVDEALMDLLYFVVDILQFNGERNAYDEVDFDSILIETIDALQQYHQAVEDKPHDDPEQHTILILDKSLHCFPWESLACLNGQAVSRLPSLSCLRERILQQQQQREQLGRSSLAIDGLHVSRQGGATILNPGGDLKATQGRLEEPLQELAGWEIIIQRQPTEAEMKSCLEDHELFLYFGHGSGSNYIRHRTIKNLEKCAVAFLMGCSSGALTEMGEFEPYGTPMNYMHARCPALVANLWDVTDKDIDRFSHSVLEKWGLFGRAQSQDIPVKKSAKQRGKSKARRVEKIESHTKGPVSLDQAVAGGRDSCTLRYLNGAAPVIYGVPVYLE
ncbi:hypothetical protein N7G274_009900 [Stereocaulon virgatum]|uniref:separase n=1 Tax=Stereocaulon virgatum TaxID=373712 RepID=A0ABR3ZUX9_9LECA